MAGLLRLCEKTEAETAARGAGLRCRLDVEGVPVELPGAHQTVLLRAAQASLANVRAHAQAGTAVVTLSFLGPEVAMDIYDDGAGFDPSALAGPSGRVRLWADVVAGPRGRPRTGSWTSSLPRVREPWWPSGCHWAKRPVPRRAGAGPRGPEMNDIRVFLVDDHPVVRAGLRAMLGDLEGITVVAEAADGGAALAGLARLHTLGEPADVVLMDLQMGAGMDGVTATGRIKAGEAGEPRAAGAHPDHL